MSSQYIIQTWQSEKYSRLIEVALQFGGYSRLDIAVAYASYTGVRILEKLLRNGIGDRWDTLEKRWLIGIDWCRSDPPALARLAALPNSSVRIPGGSIVVARSRCRPIKPYHPKVYVFKGGRHASIVCGSGNLSQNGLTGGCECGNLQLFDIPKSRNRQIDPQLDNVIQWFNKEWRDATRYETIRTRYESVCKTISRLKTTVPTDDDVAPTIRGLTDEQIRLLRTFQNFWIDAGPLGSNLGPGRPGNQLDMTKFSRVFFGAELRNVPPNTIIDHVTLVLNGVEYLDRTLKFAKNGMDKLNVPSVEDAAYYENKTLLFKRRADGRFEQTVGDGAARSKWQRMSRGTVFQMRGISTRQWGVF